MKESQQRMQWSIPISLQLFKNKSKKDHLKSEIKRNI